MPVNVDDLADRLLAFVRGFGLHRGETTPCGMPISVSEAHALMELAAGSLGQTELGHRLGLTKSTVSRLVTLLDERGWVRRSADANDGRAAQLVLTGEGRRAAAQLATARRQRLGALLEAIEPSQRPAVLQALATLTAAAQSTDPRHA
ncbi:MAG: MarR family transcriptional regulator [Acidimicrobiia bacterium]|nr:MarR family transcriptional regulator [Acidimicrobiia bacterium]